MDRAAEQERPPKLPEKLEGELDILSLGANWWLTPISQFSVNYRDISLVRFGIVGHSSGFNVRLQLILN